MKKFIKIGALSLVFVASLLMISSSKTHAVAGQVTFSISWATNAQCTYGTAWNLGQYAANTSSFTATGNVSSFVCTDSQGLASRNMQLQATTTVTNWTTIINQTGVKMQASTNLVTAWTCTAGTNTTTMTAIDTAWTIMTKTSAVNQVCTITTSGVILNVIVPAGASIWAYTGTLSLTLPW